MALKLANNASSRLASSIAFDSTEITLAPGTGAQFPTLAAGDWFPASLTDAAGNIEIVKVTARSSDILTVTRAQELTAARAFQAGDRVELRPTKGVYDDIDARIADKLSKSGGVVGGDVTVYRPAAPSTGVIFLGQDGSHYLFFDGTNYALPSGQLLINGGTAYHTGNFNPASYMPLTGANFTGNFGIYNTSPTVMFYDTDWGPRQLHCNGGLIGFLTSGGGWGVYSDNSGNLIASGNVAAYSDRKHKKHIKTVKNALELVERMRGVRYIDRRTGAKRVGVIAQEMQEVLPEVVGEGADGLHVDYGNISGVLIEAVKMLADRIRQLEAA